jgi:hypothetical protein
VKRSRAVTIAALLTFTYSLLAIMTLFHAFVTQSAFIQEAGTGFAAFLLILFSMGVVSVYGIWRNQPWGKILAIVTLVLNGLLAVPGILFGPTLADKAAAFSGVAVAIIVALLLLQPAATQSSVD